MNGHHDFSHAKADPDGKPDHDVERPASSHATIVVHCNTACRNSPRCDERVLVHICSEAEEKKERIADECRYDKADEYRDYERNLRCDPYPDMSVRS